MRLYPYQKNYANSNERFQVVNKSRQIGFSEVLSYTALKRSYFQKINQLLCSSSQRQSNALMSKVEKWLYAYKLNGVKLKKDTSTLKILPNGTEIHCLPSKPETVRGFNGDVRLDEFSLHKDDKKIYEALLPSLSKNKEFQLSITSTPLGCSNMFYNIYTNQLRYPDFKRNQIDCYEAIKQGCELHVEDIKRNIDEDSFRQEYLCEFIDEATSYFPYELMLTCVEDYEPSTLKGKSYLGIDVGRTKDRTVISILTEDKGVFYLKVMEVMKDKPFHVQRDTALSIIRNENVVSGYIDQGAIGYQLAEEITSIFNQIKPVSMLSSFQNEMFTFAKKTIEDRKLKFTGTDDEVRTIMNDFHGIRRETTVNNNTKYVAERTSQGHSDRAISICLALLSSKSVTEYNIRYF